MQRGYDGSLGRFLSPDTIVPTSTQGTQAWDRYAFVNNNPVRYNDPTGHMMDDGSRNQGGGSVKCSDPSATNYGTAGSCLHPELTGSYLEDIVQKDDDTTSTSCSSCHASPTTGPNPYSDWYSGQYSGCFMCHVAVANGQGIATNDQLATAYENATTAQAIGYTPMVATALPLMALSGAETVGVYAFGNLGADWHLGLEFSGKMNIAHIGNSVKYGLHIAFGSVAPKVADLHIYISPMQYLWRPSWGNAIFNLASFRWEELIK